MTKDDWLSWKENPITQQFFKLLGGELDALRADVGWDPESVDATALRAAYNSGAIATCEYLTSAEPEFQDE